MKVFVVTVNLDGERETEECVRSLLKQDYKNFEIIIVDNGSRPTSVRYLKRKLPKTRIIETGQNLGFAGGFNTGIRFAKKNGGRYVAIINNDTATDSNWLKELVKVAEKNAEVGIVCPKVFFYKHNKTLQTVGIEYKKGSSLFQERGYGEIDKGQYDEDKEVDAACGVSFLINLNLPLSLVLFDEKLFLYYEDIDLSLRMKKAGYKILYAYKSSLRHKLSVTVNKLPGIKIYYSVRNRLRIVKRYFSFAFFLWVYLKAWARGLVNLFTFNGSLIKNYFRALLTV